MATMRGTPAAPIPTGSSDPALTAANGGGTGSPTTAVSLGQPATVYDSSGRLLFEGHPTPFKLQGFVQNLGTSGSKYADAGNSPIPDDLYNRWVAAGQPDAAKFPPGQDGNAPVPVIPIGSKGRVSSTGDRFGDDLGRAGGTGKSLIDDPSISKAWNEFLNGIDDGTKLKELLGLDPSQPLPTSINTTLTAPLVGNLDAPAQVQNRNVDLITGPELGGPTLAEATNVEATDTAGLQRIADGQGPLADQVRMANAIAAMEATQRANSLANQGRDGERRGLRRAAMLQGAELEMAGRLKATETLAAKATEATAKLADIDRQRKELQANLDAARRDNDANRIQDITKKLADLELETKKVNAEIEKGNADRDVDVQNKNIGNTIQVGEINKGIEAGNADRTLGAQDKSIGHALTAQDNEERQRIERGRFRIEVTDAITKSAKGLLDEAARQSALAIARREQSLAQQKFDLAADAQEKEFWSKERAFWTTAITSLLASVIPVPKAKHGGAVTGRTLVEVGEAGDHELIIPVKGKLGEELARALEIDAKPFVAAGKAGTIETPKDLAEAVAATMRTFDAKRKPPPEPMEGDDVLSAMSGGIIRARKRREARGY